MSEQALQTISDDEISLREIINFLIESWKIIAFAGLLGILGATGFLWVTPNQYQATAQIQVAQIGTSITSHLGVNIEDPNSLIARLKISTNYSDQEVKACGFQNSSTLIEALRYSAKFSAVKGLDSIVELKINLDSKELAVTCANALFEYIKASQHQIIKPYIEEAKTLLLKYQDRLGQSQALVSRADKSGVALSAAYLSTRDEIKFLTEEIMRLNTFITTADARQTKLTSPIYVSHKPVLPKKTLSLVMGLFTGLFLGLLYVLLRKAWLNYKLGLTG
jgi:capsular polysaccharide biosynthesis protein